MYTYLSLSSCFSAVEAIFDYVKDRDDELSFTTGTNLKRMMMAGTRGPWEVSLGCSQETMSNGSVLESRAYKIVKNGQI